MAHGPRKKPLDFGGNPGHVRELSVTVMVGLGFWLGGEGVSAILRMGGCVT